MNITRRLTLGLVLSLSLSMALPACLSAQTAAPNDLLKGAKWDFTRKLAKTEFTVADPAEFSALELSCPQAVVTSKLKWVLNGHEIAGPIPGMLYKTIPAIDAKILKKGLNALSVEAENLKQPAVESTTLVALKAADLKIVTGPILGAVGEDYFMITFRTNMPASVSVSLKTEGAAASKAKEAAASAPAIYHRVKVARDPAATSAVYEIQASVGSTTTMFAHSITFPAGAIKPTDNLHFVVLGDNRTNPGDWSKVSNAALSAKPQLVVHTGDLVASGMSDWLWDDEFYTPAQNLLSSAPFYPVYGNHEGMAPIIKELFCTPGGDGKGRNWAQTVGPVLFVGIDGAADFAAGTENNKWLDKTLAESKAKFIFLATHYPAWTSSGHGKLGPTGRPLEHGVRQGQDVIMPMLAKYKATAMVAGHDHTYERSEPDGGVSVIIAGGAGAPRYSKSSGGDKQNPYSKVYENVLHYCVVDVTGDTCTLKAITPDGKQLDTVTWKAREMK